jgi:hypothetical protein
MNGKIAPSWGRQTEVTNHAGKFRPLPVGIVGMSGTRIYEGNNPLLKECRRNEAKRQIPPLPEPRYKRWLNKSAIEACPDTKGYMEKTGYELLEVIDNLIPSELGHKAAKDKSIHLEKGSRTQLAKFNGAGKVCAMRYWLAMVAGDGILQCDELRELYAYLPAAM